MRRGYGLFPLLWTGVLWAQIPVGTFLITPADTPEVNAFQDVVQKVHTDSGFVFLDNRCNLASFTLAPSLQWFTRLDLFECNALAELLDGGLVVGGRSHNHIPALVRLNPFTGQVEWSYEYFGSPYAWIEDIAVTPSGDILVAGVHSSEPGWAARLDGSGQVLWMRTFRTPDTASSLALRFVEVLPSGNLLFAGEYQDAGTYTAGGVDLMLFYTDGNGDALPGMPYAIVGTNQDEYLYTLDLLPDGSVVVAGRRYVTSTNNGYLLLLDDTLGVRWGWELPRSRMYGARWIDSLIYVAGNVWYKPASLVGVGVSGTIRWIRRYTSDAYMRTIVPVPTGDGRVLVAGERSGYDVVNAFAYVLATPTGISCNTSDTTLSPSPLSVIVHHALSVQVISDTAYTMGVAQTFPTAAGSELCATTAVNEEAGSGYARPCHGIRILRHGVRLDSPRPYRVLRVDGRRVREGKGRWIPLSSGVFLIQTPGHTHRVVIP